MFFMMRMAFWIGIVLVLLPGTGETTSEAGKPQIGAMEAVSAASATMSDMSRFCDRQPATCEFGSHAASVIGQRAQAGARKLYEMMVETKAGETKAGETKTGETRTGQTRAGEHTGTVATAPRSQDTLSPSDRDAEWRGPDGRAPAAPVPTPRLRGSAA